MIERVISCQFKNDRLQCAYDGASDYRSICLVHGGKIGIGPDRDELLDIVKAKDATIAQQAETIRTLRAALDGLEGGALIGDSPCFCYPWKTVLGPSLQHGEPCLAARAALVATEGQA